MSGHNPFEADTDSDEIFEINEEYVEPKQIEPGKYPARLIDLEKSKSKAGNDMYVWTFALESDPSGDPWCAGREFKIYTALTAAAMFKVNETLLALDLAKIENGNVVAKFKKSDAINKKCLLAIDMEEGKGQYAGRMFPRAKKVEKYVSKGAEFNA